MCIKILIIFSIITYEYQILMCIMLIIFYIEIIIFIIIYNYKNNDVPFKIKICFGLI